MKRNWKTYLFWIALAEGVGLLAGFLTRDGVAWYTEFAVKPPLSPPAVLFPIVWTILYGLMGIGAARVRLTPETNDRNRALNLFLWILITAMILAFDRVDHPAAWLQVPYLAWVTFALWLNFWVWRLNP